MRLIADAGSTKTAWALVMPGEKPRYHNGSGCNALSCGEGDISGLAVEAILAFGVKAADITDVDFYGAGCATPEVCENVARQFGEVCPEAWVHVASDLEGAARALFGTSPGIACILGTGSNSGFYDGRSIVMNVPPLGYILGDEGGGAALGKRLVSDALRGILDKELVAELAEDYSVTKSNVLEQVYRRRGGNAFLASTVPFMARHRDHEQIRHILIEEFTRFFERNLDLYPECRAYHPGFVGSIALHFKDELMAVAASMGYFPGDIIASPIERLAERASR